MGSGAGERGWAERRPVLFPFLLSLFCLALSEQIRYRIPEEMPEGSVVGNLAKDLRLSVHELPTRKLRVSSEKPYFTVRSESGELLVSSRLDREQICGKKPACALEFEAVAENPLNFYHVNVEIEDVNDHTPKFTQNSFELQISESTLPGTRFILEVAEDADIGLNSLQTYKLSLSPSFSLINKEKQDGSKYPELVLEKPLDREQQGYHRLILTASDRGDPPLNGTTELRIQVTDANDNPPVFSQDVYRVSLGENVPPGTTVLQVSATDQDEGVNSEIIYSFHNVDEQVEQFFNLDRRTGEITTKDDFDFEIASSYTLTIEAKDPGDLAAHCSVQVDILDENDCAPEVIVTSIFTPLPEDSPPGTVIALIKTRDRDSGENGEVYCQILGKAEFILKSYSKNYYKLVTDRTLDREEIPEYNITIMATDRGKQPLSSSISFTLRLADVNDNAPVFHQASYVVHVAENNPPGASIAQVSASDPDLGPNGHVSYSIVASDLEPRALSSYVSVSAQSGVVFAQRAFDHEQLRAFELTLQARDHGSPALSANVSLRVLVGDRNDNAPRVLYPALGPDGSALFDTVPRAAQPGYLVTKVVAVDADSGHNAWLSYHVLIMATPLSSYVSINSDTGVLYALCSFDYEQIQDLQLLVTASDSGDPPLSSNVSLSLFILDQNDNVPEILYPMLPTDGSMGVELAPRSAEPGYLVTKVVAVDRDSGQNAWLSYHLLKASEPGLFAVGLHTGEVRTARALLDRDTLKQSLVVAVQDHGQPPLSATVTLTVAVASSIPEVLADLGSMRTPTNSDDSDLTLYLVVAVAVVSCIFLAFVIVLLALRLWRWHKSSLIQSSGVGLAGLPASGFVGMEGVQAFLKTYSHEVSLTSDLRGSHMIFPQPNYADTLISQESCEKNDSLLASRDFHECRDEAASVQQAPPNTDWRFSQAQRPGTSGSQNGDETGTWPNNQFDTEMLQAMILASASEAADGSSTLGGGAGTMGLSARYGPQFTLQHVPDYRQNVYIPGSNATLTNAAGKRDGKAPAGGNGSKKKSGKKEKK
ncbi:protocadherin gamma-B5 isoform X1 [Physeter macrocephalus]|uniref:Protocadherin gamma-B5 isoform X1 n=1 Tax=Physeter macrocephalus TaxID=9755 RepID=A0A9W2WUE3_PHYMC|nr:protocadherin gamma-B5 isoform X1 [Physeter catodon]